MKKYFHSLAAVSFFIFCVNVSPSIAAADKTFIYDYEGNVVLLRRDVGQPLKSDMPIQNGDILKNDVNASVNVIMNQIIGLRFQTASECVFSETKASSVYLEFNVGQALINMKNMPTGGVFQMETPSAVIRTSLLAQFLCTVIEVGEKTATLVSVKKGTLSVQIKSSGAQVTVMENQSLDIQPETFIAPPKQMSEEEKKIVFKANSVIIASDSED